MLSLRNYGGSATGFFSPKPILFLFVSEKNRWRFLLSPLWAFFNRVAFGGFFTTSDLLFEHPLPPNKT